jgi:hypothetical protein
LQSSSQRSTSSRCLNARTWMITSTKSRHEEQVCFIVFLSLSVSFGSLSLCLVCILKKGRFQASIFRGPIWELTDYFCSIDPIMCTTVFQNCNLCSTFCPPW